VRRAAAVFTGQTFFEVRNALSQIPIIDTHEHYGEDWDSTETTVYKLFTESYLSWLAPGGECEHSPEALAQWLDPKRYNSYTVSFLRGMRELYGVDLDTVTPAALAGLGEKVAKAYRDSQWPMSVIRRARVKHTVVDPLPVPAYVHDEPSFHLALRSHMLVHGYSRAGRDHNGHSPFAFGSKLGRDMSSFDDYLAYVDFWVSEHKKKGAVAIKSALAYERDIDVGPVSYKEAARAFDSGTDDPAEQKQFGDFILNLLAHKAAEYDLVFQIHTGLGMQPTSNPHRLLWLIRSNPGTVFDLFHAGYPWLGETLAIASEQPNVIVDTCWLPVISPSAAVRFYREYAEVAFCADTLLWGGDCWHPEEAYGAALTFRDCLAKAVAEKVEGGYWKLGEGIRFAEGVMWRAGARWYGIEM
jgi:hypothetical protein